MRRFAGIRAQVTIITLVVCALAMAGVLGLTAYAAWSSMEHIINQSLEERLDRAQELVVQGEFQQAIDHAGIELLQVIDKNGHVIASTPNIQGYSAIKGDDDDTYEVDDLEFDEDDFDEDDVDDDDAVRLPTSGAGAGSTTRQQADADSDDDDWDDADDDSAAGGYDGDDDDDDDAYRGGNAGASADADDDDDADDANDDADDDADDDDDDRPAAKAKKLSWIAGIIGPSIAYAEEPVDVHSVVASNVLGIPGPFLVMKRTVESPIGAVTLAAMTSLSPAVETAQRTAYLVAILLLALLVLAGFFAWHMTGHTLRPVDQMRHEVESISARDVQGRITPPANDPDLSRLAITFNGLLSRIQASVEEQKRFVSDASHELKSPIASIGLILETLKNHPESVDRVEALADLTAENARLSQIVGDLLVLARQDEGRLAVEFVPVDFNDMLYEEVASLRQRHPVSVDASGVQPVIGECDPKLLSHAVRNLLDNAARYATSKVAVSCQEIDGTIRIVVSDDGPGIPPEDRERVFGRFVRLEEGRERKTGSTGLGLSVVRGNVEHLNGRVYFAEPEIGGATAVIELPLR